MRACAGELGELGEQPFGCLEGARDGEVVAEHDGRVKARVREIQFGGVHYVDLPAAAGGRDLLRAVRASLSG